MIVPSLSATLGGVLSATSDGVLSVVASLAMSQDKNRNLVGELFEPDVGLQRYER